MKKIPYAIFSVCFICAFFALQTPAFSASKQSPYPFDIKLDNPPALETPGAFSVIVLGDPQTYSKYSFNQPIFELMTAWCASQKDNLNIKSVLCTGDLVEQNGLATSFSIPDSNKNGNQPSIKQWEAVSRAFKRLDNIYPYVPATGNHDYGIRLAENRDSKFPEYFPPSRNMLWEKHLVSTAPNAFGIHTLENAAYELEDANWGKILIISLEFSPRDEVLEWAKKFASSDRYKNHKVIILTHSFLNTKGEIIVKEKYKVSPCNYPVQTFEKLVKPCPNIKLVICGHTGDTKTFSAFRTEKNEAGKNVHMMMFNPQAQTGWQGNGGDGWLRILEFKPDGKTIKARTYSPLFAFSPSTQNLCWKNGELYEFSFEID